METDFAPSSLERLEVDSAVDEGLGEISSAGLESVDAKSEGTGGVGGVEELESLRRSKGD